MENDEIQRRLLAVEDLSNKNALELAEMRGRGAGEKSKDISLRQWMPVIIAAIAIAISALLGWLGGLP